MSIINTNQTWLLPKICTDSTCYRNGHCNTSHSGSLLNNVILEGAILCKCTGPEKEFMLAAIMALTEYQNIATNIKYTTFTLRMPIDQHIARCAVLYLK